MLQYQMARGWSRWSGGRGSAVTIAAEDAEAVKRAIADYHQDEDGTGGSWEGLEEGLEEAAEENEEEAAAAFAKMMQQASEVFHLLAHIDESAGTLSFTRQDLVSDSGHDFHLVPCNS